MEDLSYLTTEYARNKDLECYNIEAREREKKAQAIIENNDDRKHDGGNKNGKCGNG